MKGSQRKPKALAVMAFAIYMLGLLNYWLSNDNAAVAAKPSKSKTYLRKQETHSYGQLIPHSSQGDALQLPRDFAYPTVAQESRAYIIEGLSDPAIERASLPGSLHSENLDDRGEAVDQTSARGTSDSRQTFTQLVQEIIARSHKETDVLLEIGDLALRHPEPQVRELAVAFLAEIGSDLAVNFLIDSLNDTDLTIRQLALRALYRLGNRVPIKPLVELTLNSSDEAIRTEIRTFVRQFSDPDSVSQIEAHLQRRSTRGVP